MKAFLKLLNFMLFALLFVDAGARTEAEMDKIKAPPNSPARIEWDGRYLAVAYNGTTILRAEITGVDDATDFNRLVEEKEGRIDQVLVFTSRGEPLGMKGIITASEEAFPCESERRPDGLQVIRHAMGLSRSLLNQAVYDRKYDWVISADHPAQMAIVPLEEKKHSRTFQVESTGRILILRFRPAYYQKHRGLKYFKPWTYRIWPKSVAGWCSWFAFFQEVTEADVIRTADILSMTLLPFGLEFMQIDDGYQQAPAGTPETWLDPNEKFPSGLAALADSIRLRGMQPGIWTYTSFHQKDWALANPGYFVMDRGMPAYGNWVGYVMDGSNPAVLDDIIVPLYRGLKEMGWRYFKVDALRHLRYEGYNAHAEYFKKKNLDRVDVYRSFAQAIRDEIGGDRFMMGCWGIRPELAGILDGCRIGTDGFGYGGLAQYNSFNRVVWLNDPDHIELRGTEAFRSCTATALTGSLYMLTDKPEIYQTGIVEAAKRTLPVPITVPCQIYDVDPSHSVHLDRADTEISGSGPRILDADQRPYCHLYLLEISRQFEDWVVLGRTGGDAAEIPLAELGLDQEREYWIFEFWTKRLLGSFHGSFHPGEIDPAYGCQVFAIRKRQKNPQVLATSRHITCGGEELLDAAWDGGLSGSILLVAQDPTALYLTEPQGFTFHSIAVEGADVISNEIGHGIRTVRLLSATGGEVRWSVQYDIDGESCDDGVKEGMDGKPAGCEAGPRGREP